MTQVFNDRGEGPNDRIRPHGPPTAAVHKDRITVVLNVHHEHAPEPIFSFDHRGSFHTHTKESSVRRTMVVPAGQFVEVDRLWLEGKLGIIIIRNNTGGVMQQRPSADEIAKRDASLATIHVGNEPAPGLIEIRPGGPPAVLPVNPFAQIFIGAPKNTVEVTVVLIPR